jgi:hypothetical protein
MAVPHDKYLELPSNPFGARNWIMVTRCLIKGLFVDPVDGPKDSPLWNITMSRYEVMPRCHRYLT